MSGDTYTSTIYFVYEEGKKDYKFSITYSALFMGERNDGTLLFEYSILDSGVEATLYIQETGKELPLTRCEGEDVIFTFTLLGHNFKLWVYTESYNEKCVRRNQIVTRV